MNRAKQLFLEWKILNWADVMLHLNIKKVFMVFTNILPFLIEKKIVKKDAECQIACGVTTDVS